MPPTIDGAEWDYLRGDFLPVHRSGAPVGVAEGDLVWVQGEGSRARATVVEMRARILVLRLHDKPEPVDA